MIGKFSQAGLLVPFFFSIFVPRSIDEVKSCWKTSNPQKSTYCKDVSSQM